MASPKTARPFSSSQHRPRTSTAPPASPPLGEVGESQAAAIKATMLRASMIDRGSAPPLPDVSTLDLASGATPAADRGGTADRSPERCGSVS